MTPKKQESSTPRNRKPANSSSPADLQNQSAEAARTGKNSKKSLPQEANIIQDSPIPQEHFSASKSSAPKNLAAPDGSAVDSISVKTQKPTTRQKESPNKKSAKPERAEYANPSGNGTQMPQCPAGDQIACDVNAAYISRQTIAEAACGLEGKKTFPSGNLVAAAILYILFTLLLIGVNIWAPERMTISASSANLTDLDLTGRQHDFEVMWRASLVQLGLRPDTLIQSVTNRLEEKEDQGAKLKWVIGVTNLTLPVAHNEAQLVKVGIRWQENCAAFGWKVTGTSWGQAARGRGNILWVRLESNARVRWGDRELQIPMQKITIIQPLKAHPSKHLNLGALLPRETPDLASGLPGTPQPKPTAVATPVPAGSPVSGENSAVPQPTPKVIPSPTATDLPTVALTRPPARKNRAKVAIIIDDVGYRRDAADELLKVPASLTWSVLPFTPYSDILVEEGRAKGFEIMLHLPLEAIDKKINPGPGVIRVGWSAEEVRKQLDDDLQAVSGIAGINNHMGSAGTADETLMGMLMSYIKEKGLFFIDSETSSHSVAEKSAHQYGVPTARRDIFIDNQSSVESKKTQLRELIKVALKNGRAIGIGHTREGTGTAILEMLPEFEKAGIEIVPASELVK